jgi:two-component system sensor histidine kinase MtrB
VEQFSTSARTRTGNGQKLQKVLVFAGLGLGVAIVSLVGAIVMASEAASRQDIVAQTIRVTVTLLVPAVAMVTYWHITRHQVAAATADVGVQLGADQDVVASVSHHLRDQLTVIYGFSETLLDSDLSDESEVRDIVSVINSEAVDLSRVVDDLVSVSELKAGEFGVTLGKFDPSIELERVVVPFRRRGGEISVDCWSGIALSDPVRFRQIMRNLLSNAVRHGGSEVAVVGELFQGWFHCTVADDGDGLRSDLDQQLFGTGTIPVSPVIGVEGSGLGLAVSQSIALQLGGYLAYERPEDVTMISLVLPTKDWPDAKHFAPPAKPLLEESEEVDGEELTDPVDMSAYDQPEDERTISFESDDEQDQSTAEAPARSAS